MWLDLAKTFEDFLFTKKFKKNLTFSKLKFLYFKIYKIFSIATNELSIDAIQKDEMIDCQVIDLIRDDILAYANLVPQQFIQKILAILNRGSIYSNTFDNFLDLYLLLRIDRYSQDPSHFPWHSHLISI
jgi:hypothetical protein